MPTKKKVSAKSTAKARSGKRLAANRPTVAQQTAANMLNVQLLTVCFTVLCIVFALEAVWQFWL
jgi:CHASE3 domain sensor protein